MKHTESKHSNKIARNMLTKSAISLAFAVVLSACGQRGALFIPTAAEAAQRSSIVNTITPPADADTQKK
jgi:predicted small lipoprotein YifL